MQPGAAAQVCAADGRVEVRTLAETVSGDSGRAVAGHHRSIGDSPPEGGSLAGLFGGVAVSHKTPRTARDVLVGVNLPAANAARSARQFYKATPRPGHELARVAAEPRVSRTGFSAWSFGLATCGRGATAVRKLAETNALHTKRTKARRH